MKIDHLKNVPSVFYSLAFSSVALMLAVSPYAHAQTTTKPHPLRRPLHSVHAKRPRVHYYRIDNSDEVGSQHIGTPASAPLTVEPVRIQIPGSGFSYDFMTSLDADPANPNSIYGISAGDGMYLKHSADGGKTWEIVCELPQDIYSSNDLTYGHVAVEAGGRSFIVSTSQGAFRSTDGGATFIRLPGTLSLSASDAKISKDGKKLVVSYSSNEGLVVFDKHGNEWVKSDIQPAPLIPFIREKQLNDELGLYSDHWLFSVQIDPIVPDVYYAGMGRGVFRYSPSTGWSILKGVFNDSMVYNVDVISKTGELFIASCNGIYHGKVNAGGLEIPDTAVVLKKSRSNSFVNQSTGAISPGYLRSYFVKVREDDPRDIVAASASGVYLSRDSGETWKRIASLSEDETRGKHSFGDYRSAIWLPDGAVVVSGTAGTYRFTP
jgi:hypothetical protein